MSEMLNHVAFLSQNIGPRPAGTEEEQEAALYITETMQKEAGLSAVIEDFDCIVNYDISTILCTVLTFIVAMLSLFVPVLTIPAIVVSIITAVIYVAECFDRPLLSRLFNHGVSQNIVAKYEPGISPDGNSRRRKVVLVAHYDSGKVRRDLTPGLLPIIPILRKVELASMIIVPLLIILHGVFLPNLDGGGLIAMRVITIVFAAIALLPAIAAIMNKLAPFSEGANCNASGVAVMMEIAARVAGSRGGSLDQEGSLGVGALQGEGSVLSPTTGSGVLPSQGAPFDQDGYAAQNAAYAAGQPVFHGKAAALNSGLIPAGTEFAYEADADGTFTPHAAAPLGVDLSAQLAQAPTPETEGTPEERLLSAKAAIAALTGRPVSQTIHVDLSHISGESGDHADEFIDVGGETAVASEGWRGTDGRPEEISVTMEETVDGGRKESSGVQDLADPSRAPLVDKLKSDPDEPFEAAGSSRQIAHAFYASPTPIEHHEVPAWFKTAQAKAKKSPESSTPVQRSRFADALEAAEREGKLRREGEQSLEIMNETERRLQQMRESIMGVKAPGFKRQGDAAYDSGEALDEANPAPGESIEETLVATEMISETPNPEALPQNPSGSGRVSTEGMTVEESIAAIDDIPGVETGDFLETQGRQAMMAAVPAIGSDDLENEALGETTVFAPMMVYEGMEHQEAGRVSGAAEGLAQAPDTSVPGSTKASEAVEMVVPPVVAAMSDQASDSRLTMPISRKLIGKKTKRRKREIILPSMSGAMDLAPLEELGKQRAPLAESSSGAVESRADMNSMIPPINSPAPHLSASLPPIEESVPQAQVKGLNTLAPNLRDAIPSLSGSISIPDQAPSPAASTSFAPVSEELLEQAESEDIIITDVDDSAYREEFTETGAYAGPGYVEMPKSRGRRFLDRFHIGKKNREDEMTPQEWLDVDADFDAREVGTARGGWESFREDAEVSGDGWELEQDRIDGQSWAEDAYGNAGADYEGDEGFENSSRTRRRSKRRWNGGLFSRSRAEGSPQKAHRGRGREGEYHDGEEYDVYDEAMAEQAGYGEMPPSVPTSPVDETISPYVPPTPVDDAMPPYAPTAIPAEAEQIYRFYNQHINTEVWFVALGAELSRNAGMRTFIEDHAQDLKGSIIIDLDALGAGDLTLIEHEGCYVKTSISSRMQRYVKKAASALGIHVGTASTLWQESASSYAMQHGLQAMRIVGMDGSMPAHFGSQEDVYENISDETLVLNADFVMELLKKI